MYESPPGARGAANASTVDGRGKDAVGGGGGITRSPPVVRNLSKQLQVLTTVQQTHVTSVISHWD